MKIYKAFITMTREESKKLDRLCIRCELSKYYRESELITFLYGWTFNKAVYKEFRDSRSDSFQYTVTKIDKSEKEEYERHFIDDPIMKDYQIMLTPLKYFDGEDKTKLVPLTVMESKAIKNFKIELLNDKLFSCRRKQFSYEILKDKYYSSLKKLEFFNGVRDSDGIGLSISEYNAFTYLFDFLLW